MDLRSEPPSISALLAELPPDLAARVERVGAVARRQGLAVYVVGGFVRDLLLGAPSQDLDVTVLGDGLHFAGLLAHEVGGMARTYPAFLTAVVTDPSAPDAVLDVVTARSETYAAPAALPEVRPAGELRDDLFRRDFVANTLALRLSPLDEGEAPELVDPFDGRRDLASRTLRVLHDRSFLDDPTRVLRGVRLEKRLGFRMDEATVRLIPEALAAGAFDRLTGSRLREELALLLERPEIALGGLERLGELGVLATVHPRLQGDGGLAAASRQAVESALAILQQAAGGGGELPPFAGWRVLLLALAAPLSDAERTELADRLLLAGDERRLLLEFPERLEAARAAFRQECAPPHRIAEALDPLAGEELLLLWSGADGPGRAWIDRYLASLRPLRVGLRGHDLLAAGVRQGPWIGRALQAVRRARLDGTVDAGGERDYALAFLARREPGALETPVPALPVGAQRGS